MRARVALGLIALGLACDACAARPRPLELQPHLPSVRTENPRRPDLAIGLAPYRDVRSRLSLEAQRPPLELAWLGLVREGENSTGSRSFLRDIEEAARDDAARTLQYAQLFGEVRRVPEAAVPEDLDFVLVGEIEELVGFQFQRTSLGLFPLAGYRSRFDPPIGTARLRFRLLGPLGELWSERIETRVQTAGLSMEQVALDALAAAHERLAVELFRQWVAPQQTPARRVPVRVLDACGLGRRRALRLVEDASEIFRREAGVRFGAEVDTWVAPEAGGPEALLVAAEQITPPEDGFVLVFAPRDRQPGLELGDQRTGLARQLGRHAVVVCAAIEPQVVTVAHEIAHLFGAVHSSDRGSIMHPVAEFEARFFDAANRRILALTRERPFGERLSAGFAQRLERVYAEGREQAQIEAEVASAALRALAATLR